VEPNEFVEVFVSCPLEICEKRDVKGLYAKARKGEIPNFTGISSPFEVPEHPEVTVHTDQQDLTSCVNQILDFTLKRLKPY
jgi:adenylylsulfate kinase